MKNRVPKPPGIYSELRGLTRSDFDTIWSIFMNHDDAAIDVSSSTFEDIITEFCRGFDAIRKESLGASDFTLVTSDDPTDTLNKYFAKFVEDHSSTDENSASNVPFVQTNKKMMFFIYSSGYCCFQNYKKERIQFVFWFTCFEDEEDPGLRKTIFFTTKDHEHRHGSNA